MYLVCDRVDVRRDQRLPPNILAAARPCQNVLLQIHVVTFLVQSYLERGLRS